MADNTEEKPSAPATEEKKEVPVTEEKPASEPENKPVEEPEAKETDKMIEKSEDDKKEEKADEGKEKTDEVAVDIAPEDGDKKKKVKAEEREVKPRKIPIGGIKMPGFFTKKNAKKDKAGDGAEDELLKKEDGEKEPEPAKPQEEEKEKKEPESTTSGGFFSNFKFRNPFAKKAAAPVDPEAPPAAEEAPKPDEEEKKEEEKGNDCKYFLKSQSNNHYFTYLTHSADPEKTEEAPKEDEAKPEGEKKDESAEPAPEEAAPPKKSRLSAIKLPQLSALIPKRFQRQPQDDIELGNGPQTRAVLASMETLDDSLKDQDSKDTTDTKAAGDAKVAEPNGNGAKPEDTKAEKENEENTKNTSLVQRVRGYKCSIGELCNFCKLVQVLLTFYCLLI
jgi:hypothetical protein